jgi:hypothetical protein
MKNRKQTSPALTRLAAKTLANPKASQRSKSLAGSALSQTGDQGRKRDRASTN